MSKPTSVRLDDRAQEILDDLRMKLGGRYSRPSASKTISMILRRQIDLNDYPLPSKEKDVRKESVNER